MGQQTAEVSECLYEKHLNRWVLLKLFLGVLLCNVQQGAESVWIFSNLKLKISKFCIQESNSNIISHWQIQLTVWPLLQLAGLWGFV